MLELKTETKIEIEQKKQVEYRLIGSLRKIKGLKLFAYNTKTNLIYEVEVKKEVAIKTDKTTKETTKVNYDPDCLYCQAINLQNAKRKFINFIVKSNKESHVK